MILKYRYLLFCRIKALKKCFQTAVILQSPGSHQEFVKNVIHCAAFNTERLFGLVTLGKGYMKEPNICNKYCKHGSFSHTNDCRCLAYLDPKRVYFKAKMIIILC